MNKQITDFRGKIAVWGPPCTGKTTLSVKLATTLAASGRQVILLLCDNTLPVLPLLFPENKESELPSLGGALTALEIGSGEILAASAVCREYPNLLFMGYGIGENIYSYPETGSGRAQAFIESLSLVCDCLIIDCSPILYGDRLSSAAMKSADRVIRLYSPEMRSFAFYDSQLPLIEGDEWRASEHFRVLNITDAGIYYPVDETRTNMLRCDAVLPYSRALKQAMNDGRLIGADPGRKYRAALEKLLASPGGEAAVPAPDDAAGVVAGDGGNTLM